jgi:hypothetical protein
VPLLLPECRVYWLLFWLLIPSTISTSPDIGQLGPADHLNMGIRES